MGKVLGEPGGLSMKSMNQRPASKAPEQKKEAVVFTKKPGEAPQPVPSGRPAQGQQPRPAQAVRGPVANPVSRKDEDEMVHMLRELVGGFAVLSEEVLRKNTQLAAGGMSYGDRTVSFECVDYVISNLAYIFMGLVMDDNFKAAFIDALNMEIELDDKDEKTRENVRKETSDPKSYQSNGSLVLGVTTFLPAVMEDLHKKMQAGFDALDQYADEFDEAVRAMPSERRIELGFIFSNYMYLIRAFSHNDVFMSYVITVIEKVKETL